MRRKLSVFVISLALFIGAATPAFAHNAVCQPGTGGSQAVGNDAALGGLRTAEAAGAPIAAHPNVC